MRNTKTDQIFQIAGPRVSQRLLAAAALFLCLVSVARSQQAEEQKGVDEGNYNIKQSIEFGGRFTSLSGDFQAYDTFVNLQQGPRLLGFTTEMRSLDHHATVFDRLYFSNFGYGGDPNMATRLRVSKNKWYNLDALFRKDENFWDYSLQANPLNPTTPFPNGPAGYGAPACTNCVLTVSPHLFNTRRKLGDYSLLVLPDSKVRFRAGYSRNIIEGPGFSSIHEGTEQALFEDYKTTINTYRIGVDFRLLPRTNFSYDEIWNYYKGDAGITDPFQNSLFKLANRTAVDLGRSFNAGANQPCGGTFLATGFVNPGCSAASAISITVGPAQTHPPNSSACNRITGMTWTCRLASVTPAAIQTYSVTTKTFLGAPPAPTFATIPLRGPCTAAMLRPRPTLAPPGTSRTSSIFWILSTLRTGAIPPSSSL